MKEVWIPVTRELTKADVGRYVRRSEDNSRGRITKAMLDLGKWYLYLNGEGPNRAGDGQYGAWEMLDEPPPIPKRFARLALAEREAKK